MFEDFRCAYFRSSALRAEIYTHCILSLPDWNFSSKLHLLRTWNPENISFDKIPTALKSSIFKESEREETHWRYEGEISFWETESPGKLGCSVKMNLSAPHDATLANTMHCLLCSFIPCPWEEIWYCACLLSDFKTSIHYPLLTVLPTTPWSAISKYHLMLAFFFSQQLSNIPEHLKKAKLLSLACKTLKIRFSIFSNCSNRI